MSGVALHGVTKVYPTGVAAVDSLDLTVDDGEIMVLLGPTGCGKSTVLRLIAGLEEVTAGQIMFGDRAVEDLGPSDRGVAMVFQDYGLYPHLNVADNIAFPLLTHHVEEPARQRRVREVAALLGLGDLLHRRPGQLSGGQRQRVAMARAIVRHPQVFLLDEPLSNLDAAVRESVRTHIQELIRTLRVTTVYVTHDQTEAMCLGDRVAVMRRGRIEQIGTPAEIYADPHRLFVAAFVGSPRMNLLQAAIHAEDGVRTLIDLGSQELVLPWADPRARALAAYHTMRITVGIRPDALTPTGTLDAAGLRGGVTMVERRGHEVVVHLETGSAPTPNLIAQLELPDASGELAHLLTEEPQADTLRRRLGRIVPGQRRSDEPERYAVQPSYDPQQDTGREALGDLSMRLPVAEAPRTGDTITVAVDVDRLFFFDRAGERIRLPAVAESVSPAPLGAVG